MFFTSLDLTAEPKVVIAKQDSFLAQRRVGVSETHKRKADVDKIVDVLKNVCRPKILSYKRRHW